MDGKNTLPTKQQSCGDIFRGPKVSPQTPEGVHKVNFFASDVNRLSWPRIFEVVQSSVGEVVSRYCGFERLPLV